MLGWARTSDRLYLTAESGRLVPSNKIGHAYTREKAWLRTTLARLNIDIPHPEALHQLSDPQPPTALGAGYRCHLVREVY